MKKSKVGEQSDTSRQRHLRCAFTSTYPHRPISFALSTSTSHAPLLSPFTSHTTSFPLYSASAREAPSSVERSTFAPRTVKSLRTTPGGRFKGLSRMQKHYIYISIYLYVRTHTHTHTHTHTQLYACEGPTRGCVDRQQCYTMWISPHMRIVYLVFLFLVSRNQ